MAEDTADRLGRIRAAFRRQAPTFERQAVVADPDVGARFRAALGPAAGGRILDVACGPGVVVAALAGGAAEVVGLDATEAMLARARTRTGRAANASFVAGDAERLPFPSGAFDGVVTRLALHHFENPERAVEEIFRVLAPGGRAVVVDIVTAEDAAKAEAHNAIEILRDPSHVRMLPASELDAIVRAAGFTVVATADWEQERGLTEWMEVVNEPRRIPPLRTLVRLLVEAGHDAGFGLRLEAGEIAFRHHWRLVAARKAPDAPPGS